jgi:hypothetical protein
MVATPSPIGLKRLGKTPKTKAVVATPGPAGLRRLGKTPKQKVGAASLMTPSPTGLKRLLNSPKAVTPQLADIATPQAGGDASSPKPTPPSSGKKTTPKSGKKTTPKSGKKTTPKSGKKTPPKSGKKTPKGGMAGVAKLFHTPRSEAPAVKALTKSGKKKLEVIANMLSPAGKVVAPPPDLNKIVALRAIHGKKVVPRLSDVWKSQVSASPRKIAIGKSPLAKAALSRTPPSASPKAGASSRAASPRTASPKAVTRKAASPKTATPRSQAAKVATTPKSIKRAKTPGRELWTDIVKKGAPATEIPALATASPSPKRAAVVRRAPVVKSTKVSRMCVMCLYMMYVIVFLVFPFVTSVLLLLLQFC